MSTTAQHRPRPTRRELAHELRAVAADLPRFAAAPLLRPWHLRWGASADEVAMPLPGDDLLPRAQFRPTRAITIDAPPSAVWPWLVQVGCLRAGWYADDLLDNLAHPSAETILEEYQDLEIGQWVSMSPTPSEATAFRVAAYDEPRMLLWTKEDSTWVWQLSDLGDGRTRLVTRIQAVYDWSNPAKALFGVVLLELGDFAMCRRMLRGIKRRAEHMSPPAG